MLLWQIDENVIGKKLQHNFNWYYKFWRIL